MLSPSRLLFGTPDPDPLSDEKPIWLDRGGILQGLGWQDSDTADDRNTDVPPGGLTPDERSIEIEASLNESEEERRSPQAPALPAARGLSGEARALGLPPGLPLLGATPQAQGVAAPADESDEEDADDERSGGSRHSGDPSHAQALPLPAPGPFPNTADDDDDILNALRYSELPSIGSANHFSGTCDRCCFHPKGRCLNGFNCQHCHFDHEKRKRKNKKKGKALVGDSAAPSPSSTPGAASSVSPCQGLWSVKASLEDASRERPRAKLRETPERGLPSPLAVSPDRGLSTSVASDYPAREPSSVPVPPLLAPPPPRFHAAPGAIAQPLPPPGAAGPPGFAASPAGRPPHFDFHTLPHQVSASLLGHGDSPTGGARRRELEAYADRDAAASYGEQRREDYVRQLEAENRYLRGLFAQYVSHQACPAGPPTGLPAALPTNLPASGLVPSGGGLSPSAAPFWPAAAGTGVISDIGAGHA